MTSVFSPQSESKQKYQIILCTSLRQGVTIKDIGQVRIIGSKAFLSVSWWSFNHLRASTAKIMECQYPSGTESLSFASLCICPWTLQTFPALTAKLGDYTSFSSTCCKPQKLDLLEMCMFTGSTSTLCEIHIFYLYHKINVLLQLVLRDLLLAASRSSQVRSGGNGKED